MPKTIVIAFAKTQKTSAKPSSFSDHHRPGRPPPFSKERRRRSASSRASAASRPRHQSKSARIHIRDSYPKRFPFCPHFTILGFTNPKFKKEKTLNPNHRTLLKRFERTSRLFPESFWEGRLGTRTHTKRERETPRVPSNAIVRTRTRIPPRKRGGY